MFKKKRQTFKCKICLNQLPKPCCWKASFYLEARKAQKIESAKSNLWNFQNDLRHSNLAWPNFRSLFFTLKWGFLTLSYITRFSVQQRGCLWYELELIINFRLLWQIWETCFVEIEVLFFDKSKVFKIFILWQTTVERKGPFKYHKKI